jgi:hypothetical protein
MFTCSVGDEIFGTHESDQNIINEFQKLSSRCKKLEKELAKVIMSKANAESNHTRALEELRNCQERQIHEINADHAIEISNNIKSADADMDSLYNRIEYLENTIEKHIKTELELTRKVVSMKSLLIGNDRNDSLSDYMHIDQLTTVTTSSTASDCEEEIKIIMLSKERNIHQCHLYIHSMISNLLEEVSGKVKQEVESRRACEKEFELLVADYNEAQQEKFETEKRVSYILCCRYNV